MYQKFIEVAAYQGLIVQVLLLTLPQNIFKAVRIPAEVVQLQKIRKIVYRLEQIRVVDHEFYIQKFQQTVGTADNGMAFFRPDKNSVACRHLIIGVCQRDIALSFGNKDQLKKTVGMRGSFPVLLVFAAPKNAAFVHKR